MKVTPTDIPDIKIIEPRVFGDQRGFFFESFNQKSFEKATGLKPEFVQDNHSRSSKSVLRGLHYQIEQTQDKLVRCVVGEIYDVAVDIRRSSPTFGKWVGEYLSAENKKQLWVPKGFAHGFIVTTDSAEVLYKTTEYYAQEHERCIRWDDPDIAIKWPVDGCPSLSEKDKCGLRLTEAELLE